MTCRDGSRAGADALSVRSASAISDDGSIDAKSARDPCIVFCAGTPWDGVTGSDRHMATALARYARILWVDPPAPLISALSRSGRNTPPWPTLRTVNPRITRLTTIALPALTRPVIRATTPPLVRAQIRWAVGRLGVKPQAIVACMLDDVFAGWGPDVLKVLYGTDDYVAGAELMGLSRAYLLKQESRQLAAADFVVAVSPALAERFSPMARKVMLIPNGVQASAYTDLHSTPPAREVILPFPVAGVVGQLSSRIDISLLEAVVDAGCSLLLVGPHDASWEPERFAALTGRSRVMWVGQQAFERLPGYLRAIDVGLTPYADSPFNQASFPLKTLEYLAAGLPAVSTDLPATQWLASDLIRVASGRDAFATAVLAAAQDTGLERAQMRKDFAAKHTWERRAEEFARALGLSPVPGDDPEAL